MQDKVNQILSAKPELTNINRWVTVFTTSEDSKLIYTK